MLIRRMIFNAVKTVKWSYSQVEMRESNGRINYEHFFRK
jgi:hypothetical protein